MIRVVLILAFILSICSQLEAKSKRRNRMVVLPPTTISCGKACIEQAELSFTMDEIVAGRLVVCSYDDETTLWVRKPNEPGECRGVSIPKNRIRKAGSK